MEEKRKYLEYFDGVFDSTVSDKRQPEKWPYVAYSKTDGVVYTIIPKIEGVYYDVTELVKKSIPIPSTGYGEVDLGLPSGTIWADRNVGAETPQDYGAYFSWGNVEGVVSNGTTKKSEDYVIEQLIIMMLGGEATPEQIEESKNNPEMMNEINAMIPYVTGLISEYSFDENTYATTSGGQLTGLTSGFTLDAEHDAAHQCMGEDWRMPTVEEINDLVEKTQHYYIGLDGTVVGGPFNYNTSSSDKGLDGSPLRSICFVKSGETFNTDVYKNQYNSSNKYFIELPFAGYCDRGLLGECGTGGGVWSSSLVEGDSSRAHNLYFFIDGGVYGGSSSDRYNGQSVRGVRA